MAKEITRNEEPRAESIFLRDMSITGEVNVAGNLLVMGKVEGDIHCSGKVTISEGAEIRGNVTGSHVDVDGRVSGNIKTADFTLRRNARIEGNVETARFRIYGDRLGLSAFRLTNDKG